MKIYSHPKFDMYVIEHKRDDIYEHIICTHDELVDLSVKLRNALGDDE